MIVADTASPMTDGSRRVSHVRRVRRSWKVPHTTDRIEAPTNNGWYDEATALSPARAPVAAKPQGRQHSNVLTAVRTATSGPPSWIRFIAGNRPTEFRQRPAVGIQP
jgi:hypothetical protein